MSYEEIVIRVESEQDYLVLINALAAASENYRLKAEYETEPDRTRFAEWAAIAERLHATTQTTSTTS